MNAKLTSIVRDIYARTVLAKRISALTGGESAVEAVIMTAGGTGYTSAPTVGFTGGGGSGAAGTAVIEGGVVVRVDVTNPGTGYTSAPTVGFTGGDGSGATASPVMAAETLDAVPSEDFEAEVLTLTASIDDQAHVYQLQAGTDAEASPYVIRPDDYASSTNEKVWRLLGVRAPNARTRASGTPSTLTGSMAEVVFSVTQPRVTLPMPGTYLVFARFAFNITGTAQIAYKVVNDTDTEDVTAGDGATRTDWEERVSVTELYTVAAGAKELQIHAQQSAGAGSAVPVSGAMHIGYVRLY